MLSLKTSRQISVTTACRWVTLQPPVYIRNVHGTGGIIEAHPCFDVHYSDFNVTYGNSSFGSTPNLRSVGGSLKNGRLSNYGGTRKLLFQSVILTDKQPYDTDCLFVKICSLALHITATKLT